jgi:hypothetical protein
MEASGDLKASAAACNFHLSSAYAELTKTQKMDMKPVLLKQKFKGGYKWRKK